jgi:hypothetical protein
MDAEFNPEIIGITKKPKPYFLLVLLKPVF